MRLRSSITGWMATVVLSLATVMVSPCLAQHGYFRPMQGRQGHAGDWLRHYQGLPPSERERALQNDPGFRRLPPERQRMLRQRLDHFLSLPPQQQQRMLSRITTWEHLTPGQKDAARKLFGRMQQLPADHQRMAGQET